MLVAVGMTNAVVGTEHQYLDHPASVGPWEVERLLGLGSDFGSGPLAAVLRTASDADVKVVLVGGGGDAPASRFVDPLDDVVRSAASVSRVEGVIPSDSMADVLGAVAASTRMLVAGCHTEGMVYSTAALLRSMYPMAQVAVSPHLVGSATVEAHFATLRHALPELGVDILQDAEDVARHLGLGGDQLTDLALRACHVDPDDMRDALGPDRTHIVRSLCMHWTRAHLRPLGGGFSGSALFLADGWKGSSRTEPMVIKIDHFEKMRPEMFGYHRVKDFLGKHVPTFGHPVRRGDLIGIGMEMAAMEGTPETLQEAFEAAETEDAVARFLTRLDTSLTLLSEHLYSNTAGESWVVPFRRFGLHTSDQVRWLRENGQCVAQYFSEESNGPFPYDVDRLAELFRVVAANGDGLEGTVSLAHGDLNYANVICDVRDNVWFIDWTHSDRAPVALDFAKLENDVKFVMSKEFTVDEIPKLRAFEEYLLEHPVPGEADDLPSTLRHVKWDLRYRRILSAVRAIRRSWLRLAGTDQWLIYQIALLRYAVHTLSFDARRGRGECELPQLLHALSSVECLLFLLVADDFHLKTRSERPEGYPARVRVSIDEAPWSVPCSSYEPPYHVADAVLANDRTIDPSGWADPEDVSLILDELATRPASARDDLGRPLNPRGRTGIAGRGELGLWGVNPSVTLVAVRDNPVCDDIDVLVGSWDGVPQMPKGFVRLDEEPLAALARVARIETGWRPQATADDLVYEGYVYDPRQTDHAWIETHAYLVDCGRSWPGGLVPGGPFTDLQWLPLDKDTVNRLPAFHSVLVRQAVRRLIEAGRLDRRRGEALLAATG